MPYEDVRIAQPDTQLVPNSGPDRGEPHRDDRGQAGGACREKLLHTLRNCAGLPARTHSAGLPPLRTGVPRSSMARCVASARYEPATKIFWDDDLYRGDAYPGYAWAVYVAEVAVDMNTYIATVTRFDALQEVGKVMHPVLAKGQIEGGVAQGIGYALYEKCVWKDGRMMNNQMTNYIMPTSADLPPIHVHFEEVPSVHGPGGAKGIGELPMDGPAPAILNAIENATGVSLQRDPSAARRHLRALHQLHDARRTAAAKTSMPAVDRDTRTEAEVSA